MCQGTWFPSWVNLSVRGAFLCILPRFQPCPLSLSLSRTKLLHRKFVNYWIGSYILSSSTASQSTSQIEVPNLRPFSSRSSAPCWEPLLACAQVSARQMARVKRRIKIGVIQLLVFVPKAGWDEDMTRWNMPITFLSAKPQAFPPFCVPTGISLHYSLPSQRKPPAHQCRPSCNVGSVPGKKPATLSNITLNFFVWEEDFAILDKIFVRNFF